MVTLSSATPLDRRKKIITAVLPFVVLATYADVVVHRLNSMSAVSPAVAFPPTVK